MEKINFQNGVTPVNADTFNTFQNNINDAINLMKIETYSTEEQKIGTWIDGKPLYRKVIIAQTTEAMASSSQVIGTIESNMKIKKFEACMVSNVDGGTVPGSIWFSDNDYVYTFINSSRQIKTKISSFGNYSNRTINVILEYTKTTD